MPLTQGLFGISPSFVYSFLGVLISCSAKELVVVLGEGEELGGDIWRQEIVVRSGGKVIGCWCGDDPISNPYRLNGEHGQADGGVVNRNAGSLVGHVAMVIGSGDDAKEVFMVGVVVMMVRRSHVGGETMLQSGENVVVLRIPRTTPTPTAG